MAISGQAQVTRNPDVLFNDIDGEIVMMDCEKGAYFNLDPVGSHIWNLLEAPKTLETLVSKLTAEFNVSDDTCRSDLDDFLADMLKRNLISVRDQDVAVDG